MTPTWTHDCQTCRFLGTVARERGDVDLYAHYHPSSSPTLIARFGNDGSDYESMPAEYATSPLLKAAAALAEDHK